MRCFDELEHDHQVIEQAIALLDRVARGGSREIAFEFGAFALDFFRRFADACHHAKEEQALFPLLETRGIPRQGGPIGMMLLEHAEGRRLLGDLERALASRDLPLLVASAGAYAGLLKVHISKERSVLFPLGARKLSAADDVALEARFAEIERAGGGDALHAKFHAALASWKQRLGTSALTPAPPHELAPLP